MKLGAWIHDYSDGDVEAEFAHAAKSGLRSARGYHVDYCEKVAPWAKKNGLSMMPGITVNAARLVEDWSMEVNVEGIERVAALPCDIEAVCIGNELREGGDEWEKKRFTARLSFGLARLIERYRERLSDHGRALPLTYAMEGIVFDERGSFHDYLRPLVDVCDVVSLNLYPMTVGQWRDYEAFDVNRAFLRERRTWRLRISEYEAHLRKTVEQLASVGKTVFLSEAGFPSGVDYVIDGKIGDHDHVWPTSDNQAFAERMEEYVTLLAEVSADYDGALATAYFYEWWDNHQHQKIWNVERSPIHTCFGLCDYQGKEKVNVAALAGIAAEASGQT